MIEVIDDKKKSRIDCKIGTPEEKFWTDLKEKVESDIKNMERQIEINRVMIDFANKKIVAERKV